MANKQQGKPAETDSSLTTPRSLFWIQAGYMLFLIALGEASIMMLCCCLYLYEYASHRQETSAPIIGGYGFFASVVWGYGNLINFILPAYLAQKITIDTVEQKKKIMQRVRLGLVIYPLFTLGNMGYSGIAEAIVNLLQKA